MNLRHYADTLRGELMMSAEAGSPETRELAERLLSPFGAAIQLLLLDVLNEAAEEITRELSPGSVHMRLRGRDPVFVVTAPEPRSEPAVEAAPAAPAPVLVPDGDDGGTSRINLRLPDHLKTSVEEAAARAGLSVNAWLVRAAAGAVASGEPPARRADPKSGQHFTGWVR
jgi:hypothetical protein